MKLKITAGIFLVGFLVLCAALVFETGLFRCDSCQGIMSLASETSIGSSPADKPNDNAFDFSRLKVIPAEHKTITLGSKDKDSEFLFELTLDSKGASISSGILNRHRSLDIDNPQPYFQLFSPVAVDGGRSILSLANTDFALVEAGLKLRLNNLDWQMLESKTNLDGSQQVSFVAVILDAAGKAIISINKTYTIYPGLSHIGCDIAVENLCSEDITSRFDLQGPTGLVREGVRMDMRKIVAGYQDNADQFNIIRAEKTKLRNETVKVLNYKKNKLNQTRLLSQKAEDKDRYNLLWVAAADKYFAAILRPVPFEGKSYPSWVGVGDAEYYEAGLKANPGKKEAGSGNIGFKFKVRDFKLAGAGAEASSRTFKFQMYLGPKEKSVFEDNELYKSLGFMNCIDFQACCGNWFKPLSFIVLAVMKWMYFFIPNYGIVIIILVLCVRLALHPITKKSQISMMSMQKLAPKAEEIKKKYANNNTEMKKQMMMLYKEQGASPIMGCLPMFLQMPIWIALYSAIYASTELRGAAFLPFWITDLSSPDALFRFNAVDLPLIGTLDSFNLLPILLGVSFFLQQKLMPHTSAKSGASSQMAQQQKMMMWMMPIMMLVFLYKAPSGLNLYIMASTFGGILEQAVIRKHIREKEEIESFGKVAVTSKTGGKVKKKKPKPMIKY